MEKVTFTDKVWDKIGICASGICLIHCLLPPILLLFFPATKHLLHAGYYIHELLSVIIIASVALAVYPTCKRHGHKDIIVYAIIGVLLILTSIFLHDLPETWHTVLTMTGSVFLIWAHIKNMKARHGKCQAKTSCSNQS
jgi:cytochrome c biogenesis factor